MPIIYILRLHGGKYYVGKTSNLQNRLDDHFVGDEGSAWTRKYKPIELEASFENCDDFDEDKYTIKYMSKYGIDNVRGGTFCQIHLDDSTQNVIRKMITGSNDLCYHCGGAGHFAADCKQQPLLYPISQKKKGKGKVKGKKNESMMMQNDCCVIL